MVRIVGIDIPNNKRIVVALTYIFGIGKTSAEKILAEANVNFDSRSDKLSTEELERVRQIINRTYRIEGDLKSEVSQNVKRLRDINAYRGYRHSRGLPVRGQRTKTNARTKRGKKVTVGSGRKKAAEKT
jgi:small subunit ribosomal protein S13